MFSAVGPRSDYTPPETAESGGFSIPLDKVEDFGVHAAQYYSLEVRCGTDDREALRAAKEVSTFLRTAPGRWLGSWTNVFLRNPSPRASRASA